MEKPPRSVNIRRLAPLAVIFVIFVVALLFWARDVIRELVVIPLSYIIWALGILLRTTPQIFFWAALLIIAFRIAYLAMAPKRKPLPEMPEGIGVNEALGEGEVSHGRAYYWMQKVELMRHGQSRYSQSTFHNMLSRLLLEVVAYRYRMTPKQVDDSLNHDSIDLPPEVRDYLLENLHRIEFGTSSFMGYLWREIMEKIRPWLEGLRGKRSSGGTRPVSAREDPQIRRILDYMEKELEVLHDDAG